MSEERNIKINKRELATQVKREQDEVKALYRRYKSEFNSRLERNIEGIINDTKSYVRDDMKHYIHPLFLDNLEVLNDVEQAKQLILKNCAKFNLQIVPIPESAYMAQNLNRHCFYRLQTA